MTSLFWTGRLVVIITFEGVLWPPDCLQGWIYARGSHRSTIRRTLDLARPTLCVLRSIPPSSQHRGGGLQYDEPTFMGSRLVAVVVCGEAHHRGVSFLYYNEREKERTVAQDSGALLCDGVESLCIHGICPETEWPYIVANYRKPPPAQCYQDARLNRSSVVQNLANNLVSMKSPVCTTQQSVHRTSDLSGRHESSLRGWHSDFPVVRKCRRSRHRNGAHAGGWGAALGRTCRAGVRLR